MRISARLAGAALFALALAACGGGSDGGSTDGGDTPGPAPDAGVQVIATGTWNNIGLGPKSWGWGVLLENPTGEAVRVDMDVNALNAAGEIVDSNPGMWTVVVAGSQGGISGGFLGVPDDEKVASIEITRIDTSPSTFGSATLAISGTTATEGSVSGTVTNSSDQALTMAWVTGILVSGGSVVGGGGTTVDIAAGGSTEFTVNMTGDLTADLTVVAAPPYQL
jgi:hypothetical protein